MFQSLLAIRPALLVIATVAFLAIPALSQESKSKTRAAQSESTGSKGSSADDEVKILKGTVFKIIDGDSIVIRDAEKNEQMVHVEGIDAPEAKQPFGEQASRALEELIKGKQVEIKWKKKDDYQRILGQIYLEEKHINVEMIKLGLAWHFTRYYPSDEFADAEKSAKQNKKGLWSDSDPIPPWDFRRKNRDSN